MSYEFGDVIDCVKHTEIGHYIVILGIDAKKNRVLYERITSRVYKAFDKLCSFFNKYCIDEKCERGHFKRNFKEKKCINPVDLFSVFFLDKDIYNPKLTEDSMIVINRDPRADDIKTFNYREKSRLIEYAFSLSEEDIYRLFTHIRTSNYISGYNKKLIRKSFNLVK